MRRVSGDGGHDSYKPCRTPINFVSFSSELSRIFGARLQTAFLQGPGETIRDKQTPRQAAGKPTRQAPSKFAGDHTARVPPVPIPNTEVKPRWADGTARATVWEIR